MGTTAGRAGSLQHRKHVSGGKISPVPSGGIEGAGVLPAAAGEGEISFEVIRRAVASLQERRAAMQKAYRKGRREYAKQLGHVLRSLRMRVGATQSEVAAGAGCPAKNCLCMMEKGDRPFPPARAAAVLRRLEELARQKGRCK